MLQPEFISAVQVLLVLVFCAGIWVLYRRRGRQPVPPPPVVEPEPVAPPPAPEPKVGSLDSMFGNVVQRVEEREPGAHDEERHDFPPRPVPVTRFEEFNWFLFVWTPGDRLVWPETRTSDFATPLTGPLSALRFAIHSRLRPFYPVILDGTGAWAAASRALELDPDYTDPVVDAYLAMAPADRPIVISAAKPDPKAQLELMRYGFTDYRISPDTMQPYLKDSLTYLMTTFAGAASDWLWFSVARMRKHIVESNRAAEAVRAFLQNEVMAQAVAEEAQRNKFADLWRLRRATPAAEPSRQVASPDRKEPLA